MAFAVAAAGMALGDAASAQAVTIGGPFALTAADGTPATDRDWPGRWLLVAFGYSFCPDICPTTLAAVAEALDRLGADADRVQPLFITVDPRRDTPAVLAAYTAAFDARIVGLTGTPEQIAAVAEAYGAYHKAHPADAEDRYYAVEHSTYLYLMDPDGNFVRALAHDAGSESIADTLREHFQLR